MLTRIPESWKLRETLQHFANLRMLPAPDADIVLIAGAIEVCGRHESGVDIYERYEVQIEVLSGFPRVSPRAFETAGRIDKAFHMMRDGSLCVGSPYSVARALRADPSVMGFVNKLVVPYLFGHASQSRGLTLPFGQLAHGVAGLEAEMCEELRLGRSGEVSKFLALAGQRRRVANQDACYCGSGNLLRSCHADVVNRFREEVGQKWCRTYAATFASSRSR